MIRISRVHSKITYETRFLFIGTMNPCPCGNLLSKSKECRCTEAEIQRYQNRLSEPFLDRIDLFVQMCEEENPTHIISSKELFEKMLVAFRMQKERAQEKPNGKLSSGEIELYCTLEDDAKALLMQAQARFGLSMRTVDKLKRVARTIADLSASKSIQKEHLLEALSFKKR